MSIIEVESLAKITGLPAASKAFPVRLILQEKHLSQMAVFVPLCNCT